MSSLRPSLFLLLFCVILLFFVALSPDKGGGKSADNRETASGLHQSKVKNHTGEEENEKGVENPPKQGGEEESSPREGLGEVSGEPKSCGKGPSLSWVLLEEMFQALKLTKANENLTEEMKALEKLIKDRATEGKKPRGNRVTIVDETRVKNDETEKNTKLEGKNTQNVCEGRFIFVGT